MSAYKCWKNSTLAMTLALQTRPTASFLLGYFWKEVGGEEEGAPSGPGKVPEHQECTLPGLIKALHRQAMSHFLLLDSVSLRERLTNAN